MLKGNGNILEVVDLLYGGDSDFVGCDRLVAKTHQLSPSGIAAGDKIRICA